MPFNHNYLQSSAGVHIEYLSIVWLTSVCGYIVLHCVEKQLLSYPVSQQMLVLRLGVFFVAIWVDFVYHTFLYDGPLQQLWLMSGVCYPFELSIYIAV